VLGGHSVVTWLSIALAAAIQVVLFRTRKELEIRAVGIRIELAGTGFPPSIVKMFPFLLALLVLTVSSAAERRRTRGQSGPGKARARPAAVRSAR
jgi:ABC-type uncharacterized transport system permease subunit